MIKMLHVAAIGALISSATYAYTIKYDTLLHGEQLAKLTQQTLKEREAIAVLKAEWQHLNKPDRLQILSERHLQLQPLAATQLVRFSDIPMRGPKADDIGKKLEALGLMSDGTPTSSIPRATSPKPSSPRPALARPAVTRPATTGSATPRPSAGNSNAPRLVTPKPTPPRPNAPLALTPKPQATRADAGTAVGIRPPANVGANAAQRSSTASNAAGLSRPPSGNP